MKINTTVDENLTDYQKYIHRSRYSRFLDEKGRRETWAETVQRLCNFWVKRYPEVFPESEIFNAISNMEILPSMRTLMTAGKALEKDEIAGFNCSYVVVDDPRAFSEHMYLLSCGVGVGYSVERQFINKLPAVDEEMFPTDTILKVKDSRIGWATAFRELIAMLYSGRVPSWDLSELRPAGARLKTFGGRSSGPGPLNDLFNYTVKLFKSAVGRKLTSIECHDLMCATGECIVVGGSRRCLPGDTLVQIGPEKWKLMAEMTIEDTIYLDGEYQKVVNVFDQGNQQVMKITLEDGKFLEATATHRWLVFNKETGQLEWIQTKDLNENHGMVNPNE